MSKRKKKVDKKLKSVELFRTVLGLRYVKLLVEREWIEFDLFSEFSLTKSSVKHRFYDEAKQFMFFRNLLSKARAARQKAEDAYRDARTIGELKWRNHYEETGEPRTDWAIKCMVDIEDKVVNALKKLRKKERYADTLEGIVSGLFILKSMTISAGAEDRSTNEYARGDNDGS